MDSPGRLPGFCLDAVELLTIIVRAEIGAVLADEAHPFTPRDPRLHLLGDLPKNFVWKARIIGREQSRRPLEVDIKRPGLRLRAVNVLALETELAPEIQ